MELVKRNARYQFNIEMNFNSRGANKVVEGKKLAGVNNSRLLGVWYSDLLFITVFHTSLVLCTASKGGLMSCRMF